MADLRARARAIAPVVLEFLFPTDCAHCGRSLSGRQAHGVCGDCWAELRPLGAAACPGCGGATAGRPRPPQVSTRPCARCRIRPFGVDGVRAAVAYEGVARTLVLRAKVARRPEILGDLAPMVAAVVVSAGWTDCSRVVPAPTSPLRTLVRGFDPARVLGAPIAGILGLPFGPHDLRRRFRPGPQIKTLSASARERALRSVFAARPRAVAGQRILLVDDVVTTGSTARACARSLRDAGAAEVRVACWARTPV